MGPVLVFEIYFLVFLILVLY